MMGYVIRRKRSDPDEAVAVFRGRDRPLLLVRRDDLSAEMLRRAAVRHVPWQAISDAQPFDPGKGAKMASLRSWFAGTLQNATLRRT